MEIHFIKRKLHEVLPPEGVGRGGERERERGRIYTSHTEKQSWNHKITQNYSPSVGDYDKDDSGKEHSWPHTQGEKVVEKQPTQSEYMKKRKRILSI